LAGHRFFRGVSRFDGFRQQSLVMQKSAGYAQVLTAWLKLKSALRPGGDDIDVSYRPISTLYEFWCFLKMRDYLKGRFGDPVGEAWGDSAAAEIFDAPELSDSYTGGSQLCKIDVVFADGARRFILSYQKTYSAKEGADSDTMTGLNPQRPDMVLSILDGDNVYTYLFDAKYRIWTTDENGVEIDASPRAAIDDMHRYRDAILYRLGKTSVKREIIGAYVLYPGRPAPHLCTAYDESIERENIGAIPVLPGCLEQLERRLAEILDKKTPESHLACDIPTRGTSVVVGEAFSEATIPTIDLFGELWPDLADRTSKIIDVPIEQECRIPDKLPALVRIKSNGKAEIIVKVLSFHGRSESKVSYNIGWTPDGYAEESHRSK
jgi:predicted component of viral defense system (DUF524 family)